MKSDAIHRGWRAVAVLLCGLLLCLPALAARDTVRLGVQLEPPMLDPTATAAATAGEIVYANVLEGLTVIHGKGRVAPRLATDWVRAPDGLSYTFTLRRGVRFHDGKPFDASVAAASLRRILAPGSRNPQKQWFEKIAGVEALGSHQLVIGLHQPDALLPFALALPAALIVHPDSAAGNATQPVGTGPFRFGEWQRGHSVRIDRHTGYWGRKPALRSATFVFLSSSAETENMLAEGRLDWLGSVTKMTGPFMERPDYRMGSRKLESKMIVAINNARPPFNDVRVRRALAHAIDRFDLSTIYGTQFKPQLIGSHFAPWHPAYVDLAQRYPFEPARARALLAEAGVAPGQRVTLTVPPTDYGRFGGLKIAANLEEVGFRVELQQVDWKQWMSQVFEKKDYDLSLILHVEPLDLNIYARPGYYFNYQSPEFRALWERVLSAPNEAELHRRLGEAQRRISDDAVNVFLLMRPERNFMHKDLMGVWEESPIPSFVLEDVYWRQ